MGKTFHPTPAITWPPIARKFNKIGRERLRCMALLDGEHALHHLSKAFCIYLEALH
jgi:hypothetical protein